MLITRPVSDLKNYNDVLQEIERGNTVFLAKDGKKRYVIMDITEYERLNATLKLLSELEKGEQSAGDENWIDFSEVKKEFCD